MKRGKEMLLSVIVILIGLQFTFAQERLSDKSLGIAMTLPTGWVVDASKSGGLAGFGPAASGFRPNVNFKGVATPQSIADYMNDSLDYVLSSREKLGVDTIGLIARGRFSTKAGLNGYRLIFLSTREGANIRTTQYYIASTTSTMKYIVTFTSWDGDAKSTTSLFDSAAKTATVTK